eukprot:XP_003390337.1 PREDICTED: uncharacterized protein LOC100635242 [Amphimedon queenslandica]
MPDKEILIVEDDLAIREMVDLALSRAGFKVRTAANAVPAEREIDRSPPDLILLDWMLPGISGIEFAHRLKRSKAGRDIPIIMLTAKGEEEDRLRGFDAGVDDFIVKPFSIKELIARIRAVLKRSAPEDDQAPVEIDGLRLDPISHRLSYRGETIRIGPTEFRILNLFMDHPDRAFTRRQILDRIWGGDSYIEERTVDVHIRRLRKALLGHEAGFEGYVQTVHGTGYRFSRRKD